MKAIAFAIAVSLSATVMYAQTPVKKTKIKDKGATERSESKQDSSFSIISIPSGAEVFIDGVKKGITPCAIVLPTGTYKAIIKKIEHQDYAFDFLMPKGMGIKRTVTLKPGNTGFAKRDLIGKKDDSEPGIKQKSVAETIKAEEKNTNTSRIDTEARREEPASSYEGRKLPRIVDEAIPDKSVYVAMEKTPEILRHAPIIYPQQAKEARAEGRVYLQLLIDFDGKVLRTELAKSSGNPLLDEAAVNAGYKVLCSPALAPGGKPVRAWIMYPITFSLN
jgi:TonB family protein